MATTVTAYDLEARARQNAAEARLLEVAEALALMLGVEFKAPRQGWNLQLHRTVMLERAADLMTAALRKVRE